MFTVAHKKIKNFYRRKKVDTLKKLAFNFIESEIKLSFFKILLGKLTNKTEENKDKIFRL
jgi:uncharacterized membrane protein